MSARLRRQRRRRRQAGASRVTFLILGVLAVTLFIGILGVVGYFIGVATSGPSLASLTPNDPGRNSIVYAADGSELGVITANILRFPIPADEMPRNVRDATVAIEDRRFFSHGGVDLEGIIRAAVKNIGSGQSIQGGSTLSMQLIRTLYLNRKRTLKRKLREAKLAEELENEHPGRSGKEWILTQYLNTVSYGTVDGATATGIEAAAGIFFDKAAAKLTLPQAALLAGLPQAPTDYNPFYYPDLARARRNAVLGKMADQGYITPAEAAAAEAAPLGLHRNHTYQRKREAYFFDYVTDQLIAKYGALTVRKGGLRIKTTIDPKLQTYARKAIAGRLNFPGAPASAIVTIDPSNGDIRAMASSAKYSTSKFNLAADAKRQPGSTFKVMALMAALRLGVDPETTTYISKRLKFTDPKYGPIDTHTYGDVYRGRITLLQATLVSDNSVYQQLALDIGPDKVKQAARDLGIKSKLEGFPAETLGGLTDCCSPLEMADAYASIASGGWTNEPKAITEVRFPDGKVDDLSAPERHRFFTDGVTYEATKILQENIKSGTGTRAAIGCPAAGKTGTTDKNTDAWFAGFTPRLATAVWVGFPAGRIPMSNLFNGGPVDGGTFPAEIWSDYMKKARGKFCGDFPKPLDPFKPKPFHGKYSSGSVDTGGPPPVFIPPVTPKAKPRTGTGNRGKTHNGGQAFDPDTYAAPPADTTPAAPDATPPAAPAVPPPPAQAGGGAQAPQ